MIWLGSMLLGCSKSTHSTLASTNLRSAFGQTWNKNIAFGVNQWWMHVWVMNIRYIAYFYKVTALFVKPLYLQQQSKIEVHGSSILIWNLFLATSSLSFWMSTIFRISDVHLFMISARCKHVCRISFTIQVTKEVETVTTSGCEGRRVWHKHL